MVMLHFYRPACARWMDAVPHDETLMLFDMCWSLEVAIDRE
jgi:hypothetical protein